MYFGVIFVNLKKHRLLNMIVFIYTNQKFKSYSLITLQKYFFLCFCQRWKFFCEYYTNRCGQKTLRIEDVKRLQENKMCQKFRIIVRIYTLSLELSIVINFSNNRLLLIIYYIVVLTLIFFSYKRAFIYELNKPH